MRQTRGSSSKKLEVYHRVKRDFTSSYPFWVQSFFQDRRLPVIYACCYVYDTRRNTLGTH